VTDRESLELLAALNPAYLRAGCDIRQNTVAAVLGVSAGQLSRWERHKAVPRDMAVRLAWLRVCSGLVRHMEIRES
jgi:DNA-binding transcriptional regulator YiaG